MDYSVIYQAQNTLKNTQGLCDQLDSMFTLGYGMPLREMFSVCLMRYLFDIIIADGHVNEVECLFMKLLYPDNAELNTLNESAMEVVINTVGKGEKIPTIIKASVEIDKMLVKKGAGKMITSIMRDNFDNYGSVVAKMSDDVESAKRVYEQSMREINNYIRLNG